jgi:hypothetical protein
MIAKCDCGKLKTIMPFMNAMQLNWVCDGCSHSERKQRREDRFEEAEDERGRE